MIAPTIPAAAWLGAMHGPDHLYRTCPALGRITPWTDDGQWPKQTVDLVDPLDTDICGWCRRVWLARDRKGLA